RRGRGPAARDRGGAMAFQFSFFAVNGVVVDFLYRFEAWLFGSGASPRTVLLKVAFDQFVFTPLWLAVIVALFLWRQRRYSVAATLPALRGGFYRSRVLPLLISNWFFWMPVVT